MSQPLFTIIVPTYGRPAFLEEALSSIAAQTLPDFECIVVDDASPPDTRPTSKDIPADPRFKLIGRQTNGGPAAARNTGLEAATGRFITFLDDDDWFLPNRLALGLRAVERAPVGLCWAVFRGSPPAGRMLEGYAPGEVLAGTTPHLSAVMVPQEEMRPFDESYTGAEDVEWWVRTSTRLPVTTVPEIGVHLRKHAEVRVKHGAHARIQGTKRLLRDHQDFFAGHPAAAAFRWRRIGRMALKTGDRRLARRAFMTSMRYRATPAAAKDLLGSLRRP